MKKLYLKSAGLVAVSISLALIGFRVQAQNQTFSPLSPAQLNAINNQPISPVEGVLGPVSQSGQELVLPQKPSFDSQFFNQPKGEDEAQALGADSAEPFQPVSATFSF